MKGESRFGKGAIPALHAGMDPLRAGVPLGGQQLPQDRQPLRREAIPSRAQGLRYGLFPMHILSLNRLFLNNHYL